MGKIISLSLQVMGKEVRSRWRILSMEEMSRGHTLDSPGDNPWEWARAQED